MKLKMLKATCAGLILSVSGFANADFIPFGVQSNVEYNTVLSDWGWEVLYTDHYGDCSTQLVSCSFDTIFNGINANDNVMLAAKYDNLTTFDLLAATTFSSLFIQTAEDQTHSDNGSEWYNNGWSIGFAELGQSINQNSADVMLGDTRLSWHTRDSNWAHTHVNAADYLIQGYRSGDNFTLVSQSLSRYILVQRATDVPEPSTLAIFALGIMGLASRKFKKQ